MSEKHTGPKWQLFVQKMSQRILDFLVQNDLVKISIFCRDFPCLADFWGKFEKVLGQFRRFCFSVLKDPVLLSNFMPFKTVS